MINEKGDVQLIDFGVAGLSRSTMPSDKRHTVVGTPHWMAPEMHGPEKEVPHSYEVDVWSYGITLIECAKGVPPHAMAGERQLRSLIRQAPITLDETFSDGLRDFILFALERDPVKRPSMEDVCNHPYVFGTETKYSTRILREIVEKFFQWQNAGNQRMSLFHPGGAAGPQVQEDPVEDQEWNFSTTDNFKKRMSEMNPIFKFPLTTEIDAANSLPLMSSPPGEFEEDNDRGLELTARYAPSEGKGKEPIRYDDNFAGSSRDYEINEGSVARGAAGLKGIFDSNAAPYKLSSGKSDLPLRSTEASSSLHRQELSVSSNSGQPTINLDNIANKRGQKRDTQAWVWESGMKGMTPQPTESPTEDDFFGKFAARPKLQHAATMPVESNRITLDLDAMFTSGHDADLGSFTMPSYQANLTADHAFNQFGIDEEPDNFEAEMAMAPESQELEVMQSPSYTIRRMPNQIEPSRSHIAAVPSMSETLVQSDDGESLHLAQSPPGPEIDDGDANMAQNWQAQPLPPPHWPSAPGPTIFDGTPSAQEVVNDIQGLRATLHDFVVSFNRWSDARFDQWGHNIEDSEADESSEDGASGPFTGEDGEEEQQAEAEGDASAEASGEGSGSA